MNRTTFYLIAAAGVGVGAFLWFRKRSAQATSSSASPATAQRAGTSSFTQAQEVQDFQIFSALTSAQQGSDLNFLTEVAGLFGGGSSTGTPATTGGSGVPSPPSTGTVAPATVPASALAVPATTGASA